MKVTTILSNNSQDAQQNVDDLHRFYKDDTAPDIYWSMFYEICTSYYNFDHIYTDGSQMGE